MMTIAHINIVGDRSHRINHFHLIIKLHSFLRIVTKANSFSNIKFAFIGLLQSHQNLQKGRFPGSVISNYSHLLIAGEDIREIVENHSVAKTFIEMIGFENLLSYIRSLHIELYIAIVDMLFGHFLQIVESLFAITSLMTSGL